MLRALLVCSLIWLGPVSQLAFADSSVGETPTTTTKNAPGMPTLGSGAGINQGANQGKKSQSSGAAINMAVSAAMFAGCMATCPQCQWALCAMGAMAAMQAAQDKGAANQSGQTYDASAYGGGGYNLSADGTGSDASTGGTPKLSEGDFKKYPAIKEGLAKMSEAGYQATPNGVKNPDGSFTPSSVFNSAGSMKAAGIDPSAIAQAQKIIGDAKAVGEDGPRVASVGVNNGGGGGSSSEASSESGDAGAATYNGSPFKLTADQRKDLMAGKTVLFDGEPIGVRGSNIFDMIRAAYQRKKAANYFIVGGETMPAAMPTAGASASAAAGSRMPASVKPSIQPASIARPVVAAPIKPHPLPAIKKK